MVDVRISGAKKRKQYEKSYTIEISDDDPPKLFNNFDVMGANVFVEDFIEV